MPLHSSPCLGPWVSLPWEPSPLSCFPSEPGPLRFPAPSLPAMAELSFPRGAGGGRKGRSQEPSCFGDILASLNIIWGLGVHTSSLAAHERGEFKAMANPSPGDTTWVEGACLGPGEASRHQEQKCLVSSLLAGRDDLRKTRQTEVPGNKPRSYHDSEPPER